VTLAADQLGADSEGARGFAATQRCVIGADGRWFACDLPPLVADGEHRVATADLGASPVAVAVEEGRLAAGDAPIVERGTSVHVLGGPSLDLPADPMLGPPEYVVTRWHLAPGNVAVRIAAIRGISWALEAHDRESASRRWKLAGTDLGGQSIGFAVAPDGGMVVVALRQADKRHELLALAAADGSTRWRVPLDVVPSGDPAALLFSPDGGQLAIIARDDARCQSCRRVEIVRAGTRARPRTLDDASGDWAKLVTGCAVRTLVRLAGGGVAAIRVNGDDAITVVTFDSPP
jgi:hypothetical protein